jgi:hypothetical protein
VGGAVLHQGNLAAVARVVKEGGTSVGSEDLTEVCESPCCRLAASRTRRGPHYPQPVGQNPAVCPRPSSGHRAGVLAACVVTEPAPRCGVVRVEGVCTAKAESRAVPMARGARSSSILRTRYVVEVSREERWRAGLDVTSTWRGLKSWQLGSGDLKS